MTIDSRKPEDSAAEREWQAQERALHAERSGLTQTDDDPRVLRYRQLARALSRPLDAVLPSDFAQRVARQAEANAATSSARDMRFELGLIGVAVAVVGLTAVFAVTAYGSDWLQPVTTPLSSALTNRWLLALLACVGLSGVMGRGRHLVR